MFFFDNFVPLLYIYEMKEQIISFSKDGYDPFIDYLKGLSILFIVFTHCIPTWLSDVTLFCIWGTSAVPFFLILQVFHSYKKGYSDVHLNIRKVWHRVIRPFIIFQLLIVLSLYCLGNLKTSDLLYSIYWGGYGPGSYYPWIYVEFSLLIPIFSIVIQKLDRYYILLFFIILSQLFEFMCSAINMPLWFYRLSFFRYVFLVYWAYVLIEYGFKINNWTILCSLLSLGCLLFFYYVDINLRPVFYTGLDGFWTVFHWLCYYYMTHLLLFGIKKSYLYFQKRKWVFPFLAKMGRYSYEIFLFQLFYFAVISTIIRDLSNKWDSVYICDICYVLVSSIICVVPVVVVKEYLRSK